MRGSPFARSGARSRWSYSGFAVFVVRGDLAGGGVDGHVERMRKRRTALDVTVADQAEGATLGEDGSFVVERAVSEVKGEPRGDAVAVCDLNEIA